LNWCKKTSALLTILVKPSNNAAQHGTAAQKQFLNLSVFTL
jgi:hypothetical protein